MLNAHTFYGGIHPLRREHHAKGATQNESIHVMPPPPLLVFPMTQNAGTPCQPLVKKGERVLLGQKIGEAAGFVGAPVHASVSGKVIQVEQREISSGVHTICIVVENDGLNEAAAALPTHTLEADPKVLADAVRQAGIVGMGGAAFPTQVKLSPPPGKTIDTVLVNGAECEPFLTCDHRMMLEHARDIVLGLRYAMRILGTDQGVIGIEDNKPDAILALTRAASNHPGIKVLSLPAKYPQGSEKHLIYAATRREVPSGGLPADAGCVVINVSTAAAMARALELGEPLTQRVVTVTGAVAKPGNLLVRVGTPLRDVLEYCGGFDQPIARLLSGGPMMGISLYNLDAPVVKATSGLLALTQADIDGGRKTNCIRCGRCAKGCPMRLMPVQLANASRQQNWDRMGALRALDCIECGSCSYICPARCDLLTNIRVGKRILMARRSK